MKFPSLLKTTLRKPPNLRTNKKNKAEGEIMQFTSCLVTMTRQKEKLLVDSEREHKNKPYLSIGTIARQPVSRKSPQTKTRVMGERRVLYSGDVWRSRIVWVMRFMDRGRTKRDKEGDIRFFFWEIHPIVVRPTIIQERWKHLRLLCYTKINVVFFFYYLY